MSDENKCEICSKELDSYPFKHNKKCIKCTLDTECDKLGTFGRAVS
jgi:ssDNA-binding Zn-finger/Zn-ribbon topoisomerase 1